MIKEKGYFSFLSFLPKVLLAIIIPILDNIYNEIALWLNDMGKTDNNLINFLNPMSPISHIENRFIQTEFTK